MSLHNFVPKVVLGLTKYNFGDKIMEIVMHFEISLKPSLGFNDISKCITDTLTNMHDFQGSIQSQAILIVYMYMYFDFNFFK